jgi:hypothetical protein
MNQKGEQSNPAHADARRPYTPPAITVFGDVRNLTASGSSMGKEMGNVMAMG